MSEIPITLSVVQQDPDYICRLTAHTNQTVEQMGQPPGQIPLVSVVIPTYKRPHLVERAVASALAQTLTAIEVIVVLDGPDSGTRSILGSLNDPRLHVHELAARAGACAARNRGIQEASAKWIALLDDDDEWHPHKLEEQLRVAESSRCRYPIVGCKATVSTPASRYIVPRRFPRPGEHISEYLMLRKGLFYGEGLIQTSMIFAPKELLTMVPFKEGLRIQQETDWLLRSMYVEGTEIVFVDAPLTTWYVEEERPSIGAAKDWRPALEWALENRRLMADHAFSAFLMTVVSNIAARNRDWKACWTLLRVSVTHGRPHLVEYVLFAGMWLVPEKLRWGIRNRVLRLLGRATAPLA